MPRKRAFLWCFLSRGDIPPMPWRSPLWFRFSLKTKLLFQQALLKNKRGTNLCRGTPTQTRRSQVPPRCQPGDLHYERENRFNNFVRFLYTCVQRCWAFCTVRNFTLCVVEKMFAPSKGSLTSDYEWATQCDFFEIWLPLGAEHKRTSLASTNRPFSWTRNVCCKKANDKNEATSSLNSIDKYHSGLTWARRKSLWRLTMVRWTSYSTKKRWKSWKRCPRLLSLTNGCTWSKNGIRCTFSNNRNIPVGALRWEESDLQKWII